MSEVQHKLPIHREDSDEAAKEFLRHWSPAALAKGGLHQTVKDLFFNLQDHGDIVILKVKEGHALSEWLCDNDIGMDVFDEDCSLPEELQSAVKKLLFANGRCYGLTDYDMGIEGDNDRREAAGAAEAAEAADPAAPTDR